jgi:hypothetical protein
LRRGSGDDRGSCRWIARIIPICTNITGPPFVATRISACIAAWPFRRLVLCTTTKLALPVAPLREKRCVRSVRILTFYDAGRVSPDYPAPVIRDAGSGREMVM